jgi:hypothetical protein
MTPPESPPPDRYNSAVLGGVLLVVFNIVLLGGGVLGGGETGATIRSILFLGNLLIPLIALVKGKSRFAAGWVMAIGIVLVAAFGVCMIALRSA